MNIVSLIGMLCVTAGGVVAWGPAVVRVSECDTRQTVAPQREELR